MATDSTHMTRINHNKLIRFVSRSFEKLGVPASDSEIAANVLVASDLRGVDTHGVIRFNPHAWYVKWLRDGAMTAKPNIRVITQTPSTALLDADNGILNVKLSDDELSKRKTQWKARESEYGSGYLWKYAQQVGPAVNGAVTHPGGKAEKISYADQ